MRVQPSKINSILTDLCCEEGVSLTEEPEVVSTSKFCEEEKTRSSVYPGKNGSSESESWQVREDVFSVTDSLGRRILGVLRKKVHDPVTQYTAEYFRPESNVDPFWDGDSVERRNGNTGVALSYEEAGHPSKIVVAQDHQLFVELDSDNDLSEYRVVVEGKPVGMIRKVVHQEFLEALGKRMAG